MAIPAEPTWLNGKCFRGHALREHGRPRSDKRGAYECRACKVITARERLERQQRWTMLGHVGREPGYEPDRAVVDRIVQGNRPDRVHLDELSEAIGVLTRRGLSITQTAAVARVSERTVIRHRNRIRESADYAQTG
jgi:hypothetical protein